MKKKERKKKGKLESKEEKKGKEGRKWDTEKIDIRDKKK